MLPPRVGSRPVVRIITPCGAIGPHLEALERGISQLESLNCTVRWDAERRHASWRGYLAGNDQNRVEEFVSALEEPGVDISMGGSRGKLVARIMEAVLREAQPRNRAALLVSAMRQPS